MSQWMFIHGRIGDAEKKTNGKKRTIVGDLRTSVVVGEESSTDPSMFELSPFTQRCCMQR